MRYKNVAMSSKCRGSVVACERLVPVVTIASPCLEVEVRPRFAVRRSLASYGEHASLVEGM